jgi:hypothetical protein
MFDKGLALCPSPQICSMHAVQQLGRRYRGDRNFVIVR